MQNSPEHFDWSKLPFKEIDLNQTKYNNLKALLAQVKSFDSDEILKKWKERQIQQYTAEGFQLRYIYKCNYKLFEGSEIIFYNIYKTTNIKLGSNSFSKI